MSEGQRLPHLQRPYYQPVESSPVPVAPIRQAQREPKIQPESLPRPMGRQDEHLGVFTPLGQLPPNPDSLYSVKEQGISNPRLLRVTMNSIPLESSIITTLGLPLSAIWQPYSELPPEDDQIQKVESPPFRCSRCFAYINSFFKFIESSRKCICNICGLSQDTPELYTRDKVSKPELYAGTYDFKAPSEYSNRPAQAPLYLFCIDVTGPSLQLGIIQQVLTSIRVILDYIPYPDRTNIGIITFDSVIQIFKVGNNAELIEVMMTDIEDPFIPEPVSSCCYNLGSDKEKLDILLEKLIDWNFVNPSKQSLAIGGLVYAIKEHMLKSRGGRVIIFTSQLGTVGKNGLTSRSETKQSYSEKDKSYLPAENYYLLGQECCSEDICVDIFACTHQSVNIPSLAALCSQTGGDLYYFPGYKTELDGERVYYLLARILTRPQCSQVVMRARCSNGLSVDYYIGKYKRKGPVEMEIACLDSDKSVVIVIKYDEKLQEGCDYFIQCAMLYTNHAGERLIRICNGKLYATRGIPNILKSADIDAVSNALLRISAQNIYEQPLNVVRENWHNSIIKLLIAHRQTLGDNDFSKILVPDTLKLIALYCNTSTKLPGLTLCNTILDARLYSIHAILSLTIPQSRLLLYPKIYSLHDIIEQPHSPGTYSQTSTVLLPKVIPDTIESIKSDGVYLMNNGDVLLIYIGKEVNYEFLRNTWGVDSQEELFHNPEYWPLRDLETEESQRVLAIIEEVRRRNPGVYAPLFYYFEGLSSDDMMLKKMMVEDNNSNELSYGEFLMRLHKVVINKISRKD
jgi:protein transport protein SEC24